MGISDKEYLVLSDLAYLNFDENKDGTENLYNIFYTEKNKSRREELFENERERKIKIENGKDFFEDTLSKWKVVTTSKNDATGFYGVAFQNIDGEVIVTYRGTEMDTDKKKDLITADGKIAAGIIPEQFVDGYEFYKDLKDNPNILNNITVAGHSLGGGIAQYVAGLGVEGCSKVNGYEFFTGTTFGAPDQILKLLKDQVSSIWISNYSQQLLKNNGYLQDGELTADLTNEEVMGNIKNIMIEVLTEAEHRSGINPNPAIIKDEVENNIDKVLAQLKSKQAFQKALNSENSNLQNNVNSKDLVGTIFSHVGKVYEVDSGSEVEDSTNDYGSLANFFERLYNGDGSIGKYHGFENFYPFVGEDGNLGEGLNDDYLSALMRKIADDGSISDEKIESWYKGGVKKDDVLKAIEKIED